MTIFEEAVAVMTEVKDATAGIKTGDLPSVHVLMGLQAQVTDVYARLGEELSRCFSQKELANLSRKTAAARHHLKGRMEFEMTQQDAKEDAILKTKTEYEAEIAAISLYEHQRILRDSLDHCFSYLQQVISTLKTLERQP
jgi:hypothetical protein